MKRVPVQSHRFWPVVVLLTTTTPAQRSFTSTYDSTRKVTLEGPVTKVDWVNPTGILLHQRPRRKRHVSNWAVEFGSPLDLEKNGWKSSSLKNRRYRHRGRRSGARRNEAGKFREFCRFEVNRQTAVCSPTPKRPARAAAPAPRWPNGHVRLGPAPGSKGYWGMASAKVLVENSAAKVAMNDDGLLAESCGHRQSCAFQAVGESGVRIPAAHASER